MHKLFSFIQIPFSSAVGICQKAKSFFVLCLKRCATVDASREDGRATKRGRYSEDLSLSLSYNLPVLGALRDKFRPIRYFFCVSLLCSASD